MAKTSHIHEKVTYGASGRKWTFSAAHRGNEVYSYTTPRMPGGRETADKVARIINGAIKRTKGKGMDGLGRSIMSQTFHDAAKAQSRMMTPLGTYQH